MMGSIYSSARHRLVRLTEKLMTILLGKPAESSWTGIAEVLQGSVHKKIGKCCQDVARIFVDSSCTVIVVADGSGSARYAEQGASIVADTTISVLRDTVPWRDKSKISGRLISECMERISHCAMQLTCEPKELATTLAFVAADNANFFAGNLGDGLVIGLRESGPEVVIGAQRGRFANQTVFITARDSETLLRIVAGKLDGFVGFTVMSDGSANAFYNRASDRVASAVSRIFEWLGSNDSTEVADAVRKNVLPLVRQKTGDDCSIAMMRCCPTDGKKSRWNFALDRCKRIFLK